jgi:hypothetical protein
MIGVSLKAVLAEFMGMLLFVYICCGGCTTGVSSDHLLCSLTFGTCIMVLVYATADLYDHSIVQMTI